MPTKTILDFTIYVNHSIILGAHVTSRCVNFCHVVLGGKITSRVVNLAMSFWVAVSRRSFTLGPYIMLRLCYSRFQTLLAIGWGLYHVESQNRNLFHSLSIMSLWIPARSLLICEFRIS